MTKKILTIAVLAAVVLNSCKETSKQETPQSSTSETINKETETTVKNSFTDKEGKKLDIEFDNSKGSATLNFNGETIELLEQRSASGIWYKNENYELTGKENDIELKKDGKIVFTHKDEIVTSSLKNKDGQTLDMTFNNTTNQAKVYLNGGEQIDLVGQNPGSGIWYKNDHYELRGKGDNMELTKDGKTVFKNY